MGKTKQSWEQDKERESAEATTRMLEETGELTPQSLVGFDRVAKDHQKRLVKLGRRKGYSSFSLLCAGGKESEKGKYSGGMIGDAGAIIEGLFYMAQNQPHVKELLKLTVRAIEAQEREGTPVEIAKLHDEEKMKPRLFNALSNEGIITMEQLQNYTRKEVSKWRGVGEGSLSELDSLLKELNLSFKED